MIAENSDEFLWFSNLEELQLFESIKNMVQCYLLLNDCKEFRRISSIFESRRIAAIWIQQFDSMKTIVQYFLWCCELWKNSDLPLLWIYFGWTVIFVKAVTVDCTTKISFFLLQCFKSNGFHVSGGFLIRIIIQFKGRITKAYLSLIWKSWECVAFLHVTNFFLGYISFFFGCT